MMIGKGMTERKNVKKMTGEISAEIKQRVPEVLKRGINCIIAEFRKYSTERFVWCLAAMGFCWTEIADNSWHNCLRKILIIIGIGIYYCIRLGIFQKKKLPVTLPVIGLGVLGMLTFKYPIYKPMGTVFPALITVTILLYILAIWDCFTNRKALRIGISAFVVLLFGCSTFMSIKWSGHQFLFQVLFLLPYSVIAQKKETQKNIFSGLIDGVCIGFWLVQMHCWMHRPYNATDLRYKGATNLCIYAGRIYMLGFSAWLTKYVQLAKRNADFVWVSLSWIVSVFILSLLYLTGNRGTVAAVVCSAVIILGYRYCQKKSTFKNKCLQILRWLGNLCAVAVLSLALFPAAFASVRYLPAIFDEPDYMDYCMNRLLSNMSKMEGFEFGYNHEYNDKHVMQGDEIDSVKYVSYLEALTFNIGRIIPGIGDYFYEVYGDRLWDIKVRRIETMYENGWYSDEEYVWYNNELVEQFEEKYVGGTVLGDMENIGFLEPVKELFYKLISMLVYPVSAQDLEKEQKIYPGDSPEYPWSTGDSLQNDLGERSAIYSYTIRHLNMEGHEDGSFAFYQTAETTIIHAHNIFLQMGYDYGITAMCIFTLMFIAVLILCFWNVFSEGKTEYLFAVGIYVSITVFGMFDLCIGLENGLTAILFLIAVCLNENVSNC